MNNDKSYDLGVICGRFGHAQLGHVSLFDTSLTLCKQTLVLVGSAQEYGTLRNPFKVETRIDVIRQTYPEESEETFMVRGIKDLTNEYDITYEWGKYVKSQVESHMHKFANLLVHGNDQFQSKWFSPEDMAQTTELIMPRCSIPISATMVRGMLVIGDEKNWQNATPRLIHGMYQNLRNELMEVPIYKKIYDRIGAQDLSLDNFIKVYTELEEQDKKKKLAQLQK